jgi:hypothetical protein
LKDGTDASARALIDRLRLLGTRLDADLPGFSWHVESTSLTCTAFPALWSSVDVDLGGRPG